MSGVCETCQTASTAVRGACNTTNDVLNCTGLYGEEDIYCNTCISTAYKLENTSYCK
eukprot:Pgem_evm1s17175